MPFDIEHEDEPGGEDPRHTNLEEWADMLTMVIIKACRDNDKCTFCTVGHLLPKLLGGFIHNGRFMKDGKIADKRKLAAILEAITKDALDEAREIGKDPQYLEDRG